MRAASQQGLKRVSPWWALVTVPAAPLIFPPLLAFYFGVVLSIANSEPLWVTAFTLAYIAGMSAYIDRKIRGCLNDNALRVDSALEARRLAATGAEPTALLLRAFRKDLGYVDMGAAFSLYALIEPALREAGLRPLALGTNLPLPARHGVAFVETSDVQWWDVFRCIGSAAAVIILIPEETPSLAREMDWIRDNGLWGKLVLVMTPEALDVMHYAGADGVVTTGLAASNEARTAAWDAARRTWAERMGVVLPQYDPRGALVVLDTQGAATAHPLRTVPESPRWFRAQLAREYHERYGVDMLARWREAAAQCHWQGTSVATLWRQLAPAPLRIDWRSYLRPPGDNGLAWHDLKMVAAVGWGSTLGVALLIAANWVWTLYGR